MQAAFFIFAVLVAEVFVFYNICMDYNQKLFTDFISKDTRRREFIQNFLRNNGVSSSRINLEGKEHILVQFDARFYNPRCRVKTVVAHYDRVEGSPGANDNSAADFILMNWAVELSRMSECHNVRIFFTDGEELGWNTGVKEQGAFGIASVFRRLGITFDDIFVFDACGRGEVPVLAKTRLPDNVPEQFAGSFNNLFDRAQNILRRASPGRWMSLPVPYSDNASFLACGLPAVAITMLPADEATLYAENLRQLEHLEDAVMNRESSRQERRNDQEKGDEHFYKERMPLTWRLFHSEKDNLESLTPGSIRVMSNILYTIAHTDSPF